MTVRDVLEASLEAAIEIRRIEEATQIRREAIGVQGHSYGFHSKSGILDPSRKIIELIAWEEEQVSSDELRGPIDDAYDIVCGIATISDDLTVEIVTRRYLQGESWVEIARDLESRDVEVLQGKPRDKQVKLLVKVMDADIELWERIGIAHLREMGHEGQAGARDTRSRA